MEDKHFYDNLITNAYIETYLEYSKNITYKDLIASGEAKTIYYDDLPQTTVGDYFPIASDVVMTEEADPNPDEPPKKVPKLRFHYLPYAHEICVGKTGSGKTTGWIEPSIFALSSQKDKPNMVISDPKGELVNNSACHLKNQGYRVHVLNFKDTMRSDRWNPLIDIWQMGKKLKILVDEKEKCEENRDILSNEILDYKGHIFKTVDELINYIDILRCQTDGKLGSLINQMATTMVKITSEREPSWEQGAQDTIRGLLWAMVEEDIELDQFTIYTLYNYYQTLCNDLIITDRDGISKSLEEHALMYDKSKKTLAYLRVMFSNSIRTSLSYAGIFQTSMKDWFQTHVFALTAGHTLDIDNEEQPYAIFLATRDYDKSDNAIAGLLFDWIYLKTVEKHEKQGNSTLRTTHFLLDEFGNIPQIKDFENKISTSRSRNIWFHLVVQSYLQLDIVYNPQCSAVIRDNCNYIFMGTQNYKTKQEFSTQCGKHTIPTLSSFQTESEHSLIEVPLLPISKLDKMKPGEMYVKCAFMPVFKSFFLRSYMAGQLGFFKDFKKEIDYLPGYLHPYDSPKHSLDVQNRKKDIKKQMVSKKNFFM